MNVFYSFSENECLILCNNTSNIFSATGIGLPVTGMAQHDIIHVLITREIRVVIVALKDLFCKNIWTFLCIFSLQISKVVQAQIC